MARPTSSNAYNQPSSLQPSNQASNNKYAQNPQQKNTNPAEKE